MNSSELQAVLNSLTIYNVSGEYSMVKAAAERGWIDGPGVANEILTSIKRAGADLIITYHAMDFATTYARTTARPQKRMRCSSAFAVDAVLE